MSGTVCIPNIGPMERRRRQRMALVMFAIACALGALLLVLDAPPLLRIVVFLPVLGSTFGIFQARAHTCVALAARNQRNLDRGSEAITDAGELVMVRRQARRVNIQSAIVALIVTAAFVAL